MSNPYSFLTSDNKWCPLPPVNVKKEPPKLKDFTKKLLKSLTPSIPESEFKGGIKLKCGTVISRPGYGKTELCKQICKDVIKHYGEENVNALTGKYLNALIAQFDEKPVQYLLVDDSTSLDKKSQKEMIRHYVTIRHDLKKLQESLGKEKAGVIIVIFSSHSFFMLDKQIRTLFNFIIMKSSDSNRFNRRMIVDEFGYYALKKLDQITKRKEIQDDMSVLSESIISILGEESGGFIKFPYDPLEAAIIPWKVIEEIPMEDTFNIYNSKTTISGKISLFDRFVHYSLSEYDKICISMKLPGKNRKPNKNIFTSKGNFYVCSEIYKLKETTELSDKEIPKELLKIQKIKEILKGKLLGVRTIQQYHTRFNLYLEKHDKRQIQKFASEGMIQEELDKLKTLFTTHINCKEHPTGTTQSQDTCHHDENGKVILMTNVKWFLKPIVNTYSFKNKITPEIEHAKKNKCKAALLVVEGLFYPNVYFNILESDHITMGNLEQVGLNKVFTEEIAEKISELIKT